MCHAFLDLLRKSKCSQMSGAVLLWQLYGSYVSQMEGLYVVPMFFSICPSGTGSHLIKKVCVHDYI